MRLSRPFLTAFALVVLLHVYIGMRLLPSLPVGTVGRALGAAVLLLSCATMPLGLMARSLRTSIWSERAALLGLLMMGFFSSLLVFTLLRDLVLGATWVIAPADAREPIARISAIAASVMALAATLIGFVNARRRASIVRVDVPLEDLPEELDGFSIAQISDVHVGPTIKRPYVEEIVHAVNELKADLVAVTGDMVDGGVRELAEHVEPLSRLSAVHGAYFVTGNHEYYSGERAWSREFARLGLIVLRNEHIVLEHRGARLLIAGVTDYSAHRFDDAQRSDPLAALEGAPPDVGARILLAHQPRSAYAAAKAGFDLQLSGHTHGGQFWPWTHFVRFQQPFTYGLRRLERLVVYTSRGTGYWGPPKRFGAPSEITLLRLVRRSPAERTKR
jgi:predicted MPP superfamily phosphohydrolase